MTTSRLRDEPIDPDQGPIASAFAAVVVAGTSAVGAATLAAIGAMATFEVVPIFASQYEELMFILAVCRFSAEVAFPIVAVASYRSFRGFSALPRRLSLLGLMMLTSGVGLVSARFAALFAPWLGR